jgi:hypothetical protein
MRHVVDCISAGEQGLSFCDNNVDLACSVRVILYANTTLNPI